MSTFLIFIKLYKFIFSDNRSIHVIINIMLKISGTFRLFYYRILLFKTHVSQKIKIKTQKSQKIKNKITKKIIKIIPKKSPKNTKINTQNFDYGVKNRKIPKK